ncbi:MAG TPA: maleylpyruvate isomerase family mycothiol-dependent enzyme [Ilumatobacter sp.]|nr:maleylpyruvate isomerase family mycothiol-dependent enzyme [Ilumatobacter sp.]
MTTTHVETIAPISRSEVEGLASTEYARLVEQLRSLSADDWSQPTDCPLWDVRAMAGHSVGMLSDFTSFRSLFRRLRAATKAAKQADGPMIDSMTALQVADYATLTTAELIDVAVTNGPRAARWRAKAPAPFRRMPTKEEVGGQTETWRIGYLLDVILTRDPWMHRVDVSRATGRSMVLTAEHDGRIVADVVAEWARRHGQPFSLTLTGPAGGEFVAGTGDGERLSLDAVEFCRVLSGRASGSGVLAQQVPF